MCECVDHQSCISDAMQQAEQLCLDKNLRFTQLRRTIFTMIWESHMPAKAYDILDKLKQKGMSAKPPTVYRTLDFLLENGLIHKLDRLNAYIGCQQPLQPHQGYFLICTNCHEIKECFHDDLAQIIFATAHKNQFIPQHVALEIEGECQACQKR